MLRLVVAGVLALTVLAVFAVHGAEHTAAVGRPAPDFTLPDAQGRLVRLSAFRGRVVLLEFWASWCTVCRQQAPVLESFAQRYGQQVVVIGVDWREPASALQTASRQWGLDFLELRDSSGVVAQRYGLTGVPEEWWIGPHGTARLHLIGAVTFSELQQDYRLVTGRPIDGAGVPPLPAGAMATGLAFVDDRLYLGGTAGLWVQTTSGWQAAAGWSGAVRGLAAVGGGLAVLAPSGTVSWGQGGGWTTLPATPQPVQAISGDGTYLYGWAGERLWRSVPPAGAWQAVGSALPAGRAVTALGVRGPQVVVATAQGVWVSHDAGRQWQPSGLSSASVPAGEFVSPLAAEVGSVPLVAQAVLLRPDAWYFAGPGGLVVSTDLGAHGQPVPGSPARQLTALALAPDGSLWAAAPNGDLYREQGGRWSWVASSAGGTAA